MGNTGSDTAVAGEGAGTSRGAVVADRRLLLKESDIMQRPSKIGAISASTTDPAVYGPQGWADLPEGLIHSIVPLMSSFIELLSFASTCRSWRAAFASYPSKSTFCTLLPPLLVQPHISVCAPNLPSRSDDGHELRTCQVLDPANMKSTLHCQIPEETFQKLHFVGSSYGQLICGHGRNCLVVDVFTGAKVLPPQLPFGDNTYFYSGMLSAPLASPNSHLLVCIVSKQDGQCFLLDWLIGSDCWSKLQLNNSQIEQIVEFNGQFIAIDNYYKLHNLSLAPQLGLQEIETVWWDGKDECPCRRPLIVVCGDMLLMVNNYILLSSSGARVKYKAYRLNMSTVPAAWVEVKKLENYSLFIGSDHLLFIGSDVRTPTFSCASLGRWSGRSNCLYYGYNDPPLVLHAIGDDADAVCDPDYGLDDLVFKRNWNTRLQPFWVYPSMLADGK